MNVKSCLKANNGLLYRTVSIKLEAVRIIYQVRRAAPRGHCGALVARQFLACTHRWGCTLMVVYGA
jgi:hypothetical protein